MPSDAEVQNARRNDERFLDPFSRPAVAASLTALTALALLLFNRVPRIDIAVTGWFFDAGSRRFPAAGSAALNEIRDFFHVLPLGLAIPLLIAAIIVSVRRATPLKRTAQGVFVACASFLTASLFIVNLWLKEESGRPRPEQTDLFGGSLPFVPAGRFTDYCPANCSFVSGESSAAFWLVCLTALVPARWRPLTFAVTASIAVFVAGLRVAFGAHYLSDVTIAGLLSVTTFSILASVAARLFTGREAGPSTAR